jgi:hypothetical protein
MAADVFRDRWTNPEIASLADLLGRLTAGQPGELAQELAEHVLAVADLGEHRHGIAARHAHRLLH